MQSLNQKKRTNSNQYNTTYVVSRISPPSIVNLYLVRKRTSGQYSINDREYKYFKRVCFWIW